MTLAEFRSCVAAYMQRDETTFTYGGTNLLTQAANMARRWAERKRNFEMSKCTAQITSVHYTNGALLSAMVLKGTATSVAAKTLNKAFLPFTDGSGEFPIDIITREKHVERIERHYEQYITRNPRETAPSTMVAYFAVVRHGDYVYICPADSTALGGETLTVYFDIVRWLPDYSANGDTDFLLTYCSDFMLVQTVYMLNFMIKEDQRIPISNNLRADMWQSVVEWDSSMIMNSAEDASLE